MTTINISMIKLGKALAETTADERVQLARGFATRDAGGNSAKTEKHPVTPQEV